MTANSQLNGRGYEYWITPLEASSLARRRLPMGIEVCRTLERLFPQALVKSCTAAASRATSAAPSRRRGPTPRDARRDRDR